MSRSILAILVAAAILSGCFMRETRSISIRGTEYTFQSKNILAISSRPDGLGGAISVRPDSKRFTILYYFISEPKKYTNSDISVVELIDEIPGIKLEFKEIHGIDVVCQVSEPHNRCGFTLLDKDIIWSVIFLPHEMKNAAEIKNVAVSFLKNARS